MRDVFKKTAAVAMVGAAALALAACKSETTNTTDTNVSMTDLNSEGTTNDMGATDMNSDMTSNMADSNSGSMMGDNTTNAE
jgi:hypothetical protein